MLMPQGLVGVNDVNTVLPSVKRAQKAANTRLLLHSIPKKGLVRALLSSPPTACSTSALTLSRGSVNASPQFCEHSHKHSHSTVTSANLETMSCC